MYFNRPTLLQPPTTRAAYSDRTAWLLAKMSELAYLKFEEDQRSKLEEALASGEFRLLAEPLNSEVSDTQAFLAGNGQVAALAFRGTEGPNLKDIFTDLNARWANTRSGTAHRGFIEAYESLEPQIKQAVAALPSDLSLYVCGHSLGGALAVVATQRLEERRNLAACYTYGAPRVGSPEWTDELKSPVYRVVNASDGVPLVPFSVLLAPFLFFIARVGFVGFQHPGDVRYLPHAPRRADGSYPYHKYKTGTAAGVFRLSRLAIGIPTGIASAVGRLDFSVIGALGLDHKISRYIGKLEAIAVRRNAQETDPAAVHAAQ